MNFGNEVTEIPFARFLLPRSMSLKCPKEKCSGKNQLWQSSCRNSRGVRREKKRIVATKLLKMNEKKKKKKSDVLLFNTLTLVDPCTTFVKKLTRSTIFTIVIIFLIIIIIIIYIYIYIPILLLLYSTTQVKENLNANNSFFSATCCYFVFIYYYLIVLPQLFFSSHFQ